MLPISSSKLLTTSTSENPKWSQWGARNQAAEWHRCQNSICDLCKKVGHFKRMCKANPPKPIQPFQPPIPTTSTSNLSNSFQPQHNQPLPHQQYYIKPHQPKHKNQMTQDILPQEHTATPNDTP